MRDKDDPGFDTPFFDFKDEYIMKQISPKLASWGVLR